MTFCALLSLSSCQTVIDGFCERYQQVIVNKGDGAIAAPLPVKKRIAANEVTYRRDCK